MDLGQVPFRPPDPFDMDLARMRSLTAQRIVHGLPGFRKHGILEVCTVWLKVLLAALRNGGLI